LCVHKNFRNKGYGKSIFKISMNMAVRQYWSGCKSVVFAVRAYKESVEMISMLESFCFSQGNGDYNSVVLFKEYKPEVIE